MARRGQENLMHGVSSLSLFGLLLYSVGGSGATLSLLPVFSDTPVPGGSLDGATSNLAGPSTPAVLPAATVPAVIAALPGFAAVPPKLVRKIIGKEYIDMWELLPETWRVEAAQQEGCCSTKRPRRGMLTDISIWTECYSTLAAILSAHYPDKAPHLFSYLRTITRASRNFDTSAWASYDMAYRRQAANQGSLDWGTVDTALYNEAFTGRARAIARCCYCLTDTHSSPECPYAPADSRPPETRQFTDARTATGRSTARSAPPGSQAPRTTTVEICRLFNSPAGNNCKFAQCRYAHLCVRCRAPHPASECGDKRRAAGPSGPPTTKA